MTPDFPRICDLLAIIASGPASSHPYPGGPGIVQCPCGCSRLSLTCKAQVLCMLPQMSGGVGNKTVLSTYCPVIPVSHRQTRCQSCHGRCLALAESHNHRFYAQPDAACALPRLRPEASGICVVAPGISPGSVLFAASRHFCLTVGRQVHYRFRGRSVPATAHSPGWALNECTFVGNCCSR